MFFVHVEVEVAIDVAAGMASVGSEKRELLQRRRVGSTSAAVGMLQEKVDSDVVGVGRYPIAWLTIACSVEGTGKE